MWRYTLKLTVAAATVAALSGCYGAKMMKGPINAEHASLQADSLRAENRRLLHELTELGRQLAEEREARSYYQAETSVKLAEMEESMRILISRFEDSQQRATRKMPVRPDPVPRVATDTTSTDSNSVNRSGGTAEELYRAAYLDLTRGNYSLAVTGFQNYLVRYPTGEHLPEVRYYMGECYYAGERYLEAVAEFQYVVREFPDSRLVPTAYLKTGRCYSHLEEKYLAEKAFRALIDKHPNTEEAEQARSALQELEG